MSDAQRAALAAKAAGAHEALALMDAHLARAAGLAADRFTLADIALFAYTHVADEGGVDLTRYPNVQAWLTRVEAMPDHVGMAG